MKAFIAESVIGILALDKRGKVVDRALFPRDIEKIADILEKISEGALLDETLKIIKRLRKRRYSEFIFEDAKLASVVREKIGVKSGVEISSVPSNIMRENIEKLAVEVGFVGDKADFRDFLRETSIAIARRKIKLVMERRDSLIVQMIYTADELTKTLNLLSIKVRDWYGLHFPELGRLIKKHDLYLKLVAKFGRREKFSYNMLLKTMPKEKAKAIAEISDKSVGASFSEEEVKLVRCASKALLALYKLKDDLDNRISELMSETAPNLRAIAGSQLGARLMAIAGGMDKLARMPASKIQILGAEKALFRALKTGARPPKHGIIFQHPDIHSAKKWQRGKIARLLASKIAVAARADVYTGKDLALSLVEDYKRRVKAVIG